MTPPVRSVRDLLDAIAEGSQPRYLMFWGHRSSGAAGPGSGWLSQWWPVTFTVERLAYPSAEHYMMAAKATLFGDAETAARIRQAPHPSAAKVRKAGTS